MTEHCTTRHEGLLRRVMRPLGRFMLWWFGMFALLGPLSTCPVCGQPGCGGGMASAGILGGLAAAAPWLPRRPKPAIAPSPPCAGPATFHPSRSA